jgi:hypothetical protein
LNVLKESLLKNKNIITQIEVYRSMIEHIEVISRVRDIIGEFARFELCLHGKNLNFNLLFYVNYVSRV